MAWWLKLLSPIPLLGLPGTMAKAVFLDVISFHESSTRDKLWGKVEGMHFGRTCSEGSGLR